MNRIRRAWCPLAVVAVLACGDGDGDAAPQPGEGAEGEVGASAEMADSVPPASLDRWDVRLDVPGRSDSRFQMEPAGRGFTVTTGPAGIAWRPSDQQTEGDFSVTAEFTQRNAPVDHQEGYGILVGGRNLGEQDQQYTYFLVRGDGRFLVKRRDGTATREMVDWTESPDVQAITRDGESVSNVLEVRVRGDQVEFVANGTTVETMPAEDVDPWGIAGVRVNHNLDVQVDGWSVDGGGS